MSPSKASPLFKRASAPALKSIRCVQLEVKYKLLVASVMQTSFPRHSERNMDHSNETDTQKQPIQTITNCQPLTIGPLDVGPKVNGSGCGSSGKKFSPGIV